tara:strand:+ start:948 stop:1748 length:801 start_codon:yes stop_codon:yes gene_type:complete
MKRAKSKKRSTETVSFVASTASPDRYGDVIDQRGWDTTAYNKNPVVLLNHDSSELPIGKGNVSIKNGQLVIDVEFDDQDPKAQEVKRKSQAGFLNAVSVGFRPLESVSRFQLSKDNPHYGQKGTYFSKAELLEVSIVTIPANGEATMLEQRFYDMKKNIVEEIRSIIKDEFETQFKHILSVTEEDDRYIVEFARAEPSEEVEEDEMEEEEIEELEYKEDEEEEKNISEESTEDMEEKQEEEEEEEEEKEKNYIESLTEAFAYILHS